MSSVSKVRPPVHVLRGIIRHLKSRCKSSENEFVLNRHREYAHLPASSTEAARLRSVASDYLSLISDVEERRRLHDLDAGVEKKLDPKEMSRRAAARAGLQMPKEYSP
mmetsp:Transcript_2837/g.5911  ORF Transcript_2837/g.5911 Transcript_2837/m.5911 type:complete len:108 (+) Transcript_2837:88-411(+)